MPPLLNIGCLHTAKSNIAVFEAARRALGLDDVMLKHRVRGDLLAAAEKAGGLTPEIIERTAAELVALAKGLDGVLLTCSTLGPAAAVAAAQLAAPILRTDSALAAEAVRGGGMVIVLCAAGTTIGPTRALFEEAAVATGATVEVRLVPGAWDLFRAGRHNEYLHIIAEAADLAAAEGPVTVVLAQASMAEAAPLAASRPLTSPEAGVAAIVAAVQAAAKSS